MANIYDMADTWNDAGTVFTAIKMNVTDTASDADSLLMDLQVGGSSKFSVEKNGNVVCGRVKYASNLFFGVGPTNYQRFSSSGMVLRDGTSLGFGSMGGGDTFLYRDTAGILAQRNGTNPQEFRLYNTYTNSTDYERGFMRWNSNVFEIGAEVDGTGVSRSMAFYTAGTKRLEIDNSGHTKITAGRQFYLGSVVYLRESASQLQLIGGSLEMQEMTAPSAPSADAVRIYAEDNGSGKTRLMALFPTGAAQQIAIEP